MRDDEYRSAATGGVFSYAESKVGLAGRRQHLVIYVEYSWPA